MAMNARLESANKRRDERDGEKIDLAVTGMSCAGCAANVKKATAKATVPIDPDLVARADLVRAIRDAGYGVAVSAEAPGAGADKEYRSLRTSVIWGGALALIIFLGSMRHWFPWMPAFLQNFFVLWALATPVQFVLGLRFYRGAWSALKHGSANMNTLVAVGTSAAYLFSVAATVLPGFFRGAGVEPQVYFDTSAVIIVLVLFGRMLEARAKGKTSDAIRRLMGLRPRTAHIIEGDSEREIPAEDVRAGDVLI